MLFNVFLKCIQSLYSTALTFGEGNAKAVFFHNLALQIGLKSLEAYGFVPGLSLCLSCI